DIRKKRFNEKAEDLRNFYNDFGKKRYGYFLVFDGADQLVMVISMAISIGLAVNFKMTSGEYTAFLTYLLYICGSFVDMIFFASDIQDQKVSTKRMYGLLEKEDRDAAMYGSKKVSDKPHITIKNLTVRAEEKELIKDITIDIPYGKKIGIMGKTGCGKSVLLRAMQAFCEYDEGAIEFDGVNSREYDRGEIARAFSYAMQDVFLLSNTIESNIAFYNPEADEREIRRCGRAAEVDEFAYNFKEGYNTVIGEKGFGLSGGQKQRVAIARALLKNAPVIVLDDCTSALDIETESKIFNNLSEFFQGKSIVMATHRAMALKDFDEILYMENGRIIERGTFKELMESDGHYASIYKQQMDKEVYAGE
ncbi:MAG: ABC transporter ATP-binding protein, partial [Lachnospiraceae bacterium]